MATLGEVTEQLLELYTNAESSSMSKSDFATEMATIILENAGTDSSSDDVVFVYIVGTTDFSSNWLSETIGGTPLTPVNGKIYVISTSGDYENSMFKWNGTEYVELYSAPASKLKTARTITLSEDVSGSTEFDGSEDVTIKAVVKDNSHNHTIDNITDLQDNLFDIQTNIDTVSANLATETTDRETADSTHATLTGSSAHGATSAATANQIITRDANGRAKVVAPAEEDDIALKSNVTAEKTTREAADTTLQTNIDTLATTVSSTYATKTELSAKQDTLTFDTTPTSGSTNPVTSGGIKTAIDAVEGGAVASADKWTTARTISLTDADGTNSGTAISLDGSADKTLKLPSIIKATVSGTATNSTELAGVTPGAGGLALLATTAVDTAPASGSTNAVTSGGVYNSINTLSADTIHKSGTTSGNTLTNGMTSKSVTKSPVASASFSTTAGTPVYIKLCALPTAFCGSLFVRVYGSNVDDNLHFILANYAGTGESHCSNLITYSKYAISIGVTTLYSYITGATRELWVKVNPGGGDISVLLYADFEAYTFITPNLVQQDSSLPAFNWTYTFTEYQGVIVKNLYVNVINDVTPGAGGLALLATTAVDTAPASGSTNAVTSGGVYNSINTLDQGKMSASAPIIPNVTSDPSSPATGQIWFRTDI